MTVALTRRIGTFLEALTDDQIPDAAAAIAVTGFADCLACGFAGLDEPVVRLVREALPTVGNDGEATLLTDTHRASARDAALLNAVACHALDYDDVALFGHPSVVLVPAILAEGEALGATGRDALRAYLAGYEVWSDLIGRDRQHHHAKGWHPTGVFGVVAAAAAGATLRRLDAERASHAIGLAAAMAAGLTANFGAMAKPFQAGRAAQNGLLAARLAAAGVTASPDVLEQPTGFLQAISPGGDVDLEREPTFGQEWTILRHGLTIKPYPVCFYAQRGVTAMFALLAAHPVTPTQVRRIRVLLGPIEAGILKHHLPETGLEAKFSCEFTLAAAIVAGRVGLRELTDAFVQRADVQDVLQRVHVMTTDDIDPEMPTRSRVTRVVVELTDGTTLESPEIAQVPGSMHEPLTREELWGKFRDCTRAHLSEDAARGMFERVHDLARMETVAAVLHG